MAKGVASQQPGQFTQAHTLHTHIHADRQAPTTHAREHAELVCIDEGLGGGTEQQDPSIAQASGPKHLFLGRQSRCPSTAPSQDLRPLALPLLPIGSETSPLDTLSRLCRLSAGHSPGMRPGASRPAVESRLRTDPAGWNEQTMSER